MTEQDDLMATANAEVEGSISEALGRLPAQLDALQQSLRLAGGPAGGEPDDVHVAFPPAWRARPGGGGARHVATQIQRAISATLEASRG